MLTGVRILYLANDARYFLSHRLPVARAAANQGAEIHVAAPLHEPSRAQTERQGFYFHPIRLSRRSIGLSELFTLLDIISAYRRIRPQIVHAVTIKPVIYGGIAATLVPGTGFVATISGRGHVFLAEGRLASLRRGLAIFAYKVALSGKAKRVIFQNADDRQYFTEHGVVKPDRTVLIRGSGVDIHAFPYSPEPPSEEPLVVLAARMLRTKGVEEFASAARILSSQGMRARFVLVGPTDPGNPDTLTEAELANLTSGSPLEWWGERSDIAEIFKKAAVICLPSHGEGLPKVLLEACSIGRPIVATDVPGCREVVRHGSNGLLVPKGNVQSLAQAIATLLNDAHLRKVMGRNGRILVEAQFSTRSVADQTLQLYQTTLSALPRSISRPS